MGAYALDSWRMFCVSEDEWQNVEPADKELSAWMRWRWAKEGKNIENNFQDSGINIERKTYFVEE
jgi:hypothetical protein